MTKEFPYLKDRTMLLTIRGEPSGEWAIFIDTKKEELILIAPNAINSPTFSLSLTSDAAWQLLRDCKTRNQTIGRVLGMLGTRDVTIQSSDGKWLYHAKIMAYIWELLRNAID